MLPAQPQYTRQQDYIDRLLALLRTSASAPRPGLGLTSPALIGAGLGAAHLGEPVPGVGGLAPIPGLDPFGGGGPPGGQPGMGPLGGPPPALGGEQGSDYAPSLGGPPPGGPLPGGLPPAAPPPIPSPPPAGGGGGGSFAGGAGQPNLDATRAAGLGPPGQPLPGGPPNLGGGPGILNVEAAQNLYAKPDLALQMGFEDAGINPFRNPYAQSAMQRLAPVMQALSDFYAIIGGGDPMNPSELTTTMPAVVSGIMGGSINPKQLLAQINSMSDNEQVRDYLVNVLGPDAYLAIEAAVGGQSPRLAASRKRLSTEKIARQASDQQRRAMRGETDIDEGEWLKIVRGR